MSRPTVVIGAWKSPRRVLGEDRIEVDVVRQTIRRGTQVARLPRRIFRFAAGLIAASPRHVSHFDMDIGLYGDRPDGGPEYMTTIRGLAASESRRVLEPLGIHIITAHGTGYRCEFSDASSLQQVAA